MRVSLLITCQVDLVEPEIGAATVRVLRAAGCEVTVNLAQTCCGQPGWNAGHAEEAARVARTTLGALAADLDGGCEAVVVPAGSCATMVKVFWPELFEVVGDSESAERARAVGERTHELSSFLVARDLPGLALERPVRAAHHHSCHMLRELGVHDAPLVLLDGIEGCERVAWDGEERCCGFGGLFSVKLPEVSVAMADHKLERLAEVGADVLVGCDASCLAQLRSRSEAEGTPVVTRHLAQVLDAALPS